MLVKWVSLQHSNEQNYCKKWFEASRFVDIGERLTLVTIEIAVNANNNVIPAIFAFSSKLCPE